MPVAEQFVLGLDRLSRYYLAKSRGVTGLADKYLEYLQNPVAGADGLAETILSLRYGEGLDRIALCYLKPCFDRLGRNTYWNHTLLFRAEDYAQVGAHPLVFDEVLRKIPSGEELSQLEFSPYRLDLTTELLSGLHHLPSKSLESVYAGLLASILSPYNIVHIELPKIQDCMSLAYAILASLPSSIRGIGYALTNSVISADGLSCPLIISRNKNRNITFQGRENPYVMRLAQSLASSITPEQLQMVHSDFDALYVKARQTLSPRVAFRVALYGLEHRDADVIQALDRIVDTQL
jgi:hypothetical protein